MQKAGVFFDVSRLQFLQPQDKSDEGTPPFQAPHFSFLLPWLLNYSCCGAKTVARCPPIYLMCFVVMETCLRERGPTQFKSVMFPEDLFLRPSDNNKVRKSPRPANRHLRGRPSIKGTSLGVHRLYLLYTSYHFHGFP